LLVLIDVFTGFVVLRPLKSTTADEVAQHLWDIFCIIGIPKILQSDNGPEFQNQILKALCKLTGIDKRYIAPYNPRADGKVERAVGSVVMIIKKMLYGRRDNWSLFVPATQLSFNAKISALTGSTPFSLMYGRTLNELKDYTTGDDPVPISLDDWQQHQEKVVSVIYPAICDKIRGTKDAMVKRLNANRRLLLPTAMPNGAVVYLRDPIHHNKFDPKYVGPYYIVRRARSGNYVLRDASGDVLDRHVPADQLKLVSKKARGKDQKGGVYYMSKIVAHRGDAGNYEYLIDWEGYKERTWEPADNIHSVRAINEYWESLKSNSSSQ
jgi:hypothetical protein